MDKNSLRNNGNETVFHRQDLFIDCIQYHQSWEKYSSIFESVILFWETKKKKNFLFRVAYYWTTNFFNCYKYRSRNLQQNSEKKRNFSRMWHDCYIVLHVCLFPFVYFIFFFISKYNYCKLKMDKLNNLSKISRIELKS